MNNISRIGIYLLLLILMGACGKAPATAQLTEAIPSPVSPATATPTVVITSLPTFTPIIDPTITPTVDPAKLPAEIKSSIVIEALDAFDGHNLRRISGWRKGFDGFEWMDIKHLLLYPITGKAYGEHIGNNAWFSYPAVINLDTSKTWLPPTEYKYYSPFSKSSHDFLPKWSAQSGVLLATGTDIATLAYSPDGDLLKTYEGELADISPNGTKILLVSQSSIFDPSAGPPKTRWIDLLNNKEILFHWRSPPLIRYDNSRPIWSSDEMSIYAKAPGDHLYGNLKTGESFVLSDVITYEDDADLEKIDLMRLVNPHSFGTWVLNDTYMLVRWDEYYEGTPGFLSFFDPAKKEYRNLSALAGLPYVLEVAATEPSFPCDNGQPLAAPGGRYVWLNCKNDGRLIDMKTFKVKTFHYYSETSLKWSADGNFAFISDSGSGFAPQILSAAANLLTPMPENALCSAWHPKQNVFVYMDNKKSLSIFDARSLSVGRTVALPTNFDCPVWDHRGNKLIMIAEDESLWRIDYPALNHLEQLTKPIKGLKDFSSSPDDTLIALSADTDIYIVDTNSRP